MATATAGQVINELPIGVFKTLDKTKPMGALQARKQASGAVAFYWRYSIGTSSERVMVGLYDSTAAPKSLEPTAKGYSYAAAMRAAENLAVEHHRHRDEGGRPALVAAQREAKAAAAEQKRIAASATLENLLNAYCDHLEAIGRRSHKDARSIFKLHIMEAKPKVAALPAKDVTTEQFSDLMRTLHEAGKGRTANKLRSYARAAYQLAKVAKSSHVVPVLFKSFAVVLNPVSDIPPDGTANRADKRPLNTEEMRTYWRAIRDLPGFKGAVLRLHLLTGGQRVEQLVNLKTSNIGADQFMLHDGKGRPGKAAREHSVPLIKGAVKAMAECKPVGLYALSTDGGKTHLAATTLSDWSAEAIGDAIDGFQAKRIRSGVETLLASLSISKEVRGRLQSHGITGVQDTHYNDFDYMPQKRKALEALQRALDQKSATVTPIKGRRAAQ